MTDREVTHVIPLNDLRDHEASKTCWCKPSQDDDEPLVWIHHSMDGREEYKNGRKLS